MRTFEDLATARGKRRLVLEVAPEHAAAMAMYRSCGFVQTDERSAVHGDRTLVYQHLFKTL